MTPSAQCERAVEVRSTAVGPGFRSGPFLRAFLSASLAAISVQLAAAESPSEQKVVILGPKEEMGLAVDASAKEYSAKPGEESYTFHFAVKNTSVKELVINQVRTSCGCTIAKLPSQPWHIAPGEGGDIALIMDLRGKTGTITKTATIDLPTSFKELTLVVHVPDASALPNPNRDVNQQLALLDRQSVFRGECADCHVQPARNQMGPSLYTAACGICHESKNRASAVPDLHALKQPTDVVFWRNAVMHGKPNSMMPAFAQSDGGPLTGPQIDSLVTYLASQFKAANLDPRH